MLGVLRRVLTYVRALPPKRVAWFSGALVAAAIVAYVAFRFHGMHIDTPVVHFLGHSLGGLVVRTMLSQSSWQRPGRVLTLGTPHLGSHAARYLGANPALAWILGKSLRQGLDGDIPPWPGDREVATIAGDKALGAGRIVPGLPKPNDGTVAVAETELGPDHAHVVLAVTHSSMLISRRVADYACVYLKTGRFPEPGSSTAL